MGLHKCMICGRNEGVYLMKISDDGQEFDTHVCGSCWDVIAEIAKRVVHYEIQKLKEELACTNTKV